MDAASDRRPRLLRLRREDSGPALAFLFFVYVALVLRTAWVSDDSFITMRTVDNWVHGHGLTRERWATIARYHLGAYDALIDIEAYRHTALVRRTLASLPATTPEGSSFRGPDATVFEGSGLDVRLEGLRHATLIHASLDGNDAYRFELYRGTRLVGTAETHAVSGGGMRGRPIAIPQAPAAAGYDRIRVLPIGGDGLHALGALTLDEGAGR